MVNRRQHAKEAADDSLANRVSSPGEGRPIEEERISMIYELTDIGELNEDDAQKVLKSIDISNTPVTDLIIKVQEQVEAIMSEK